MKGQIKIERTESRIVVQTPYHPEFPPAAKRMGGKWDAANRVWVFDARDEERVRALVRGLFGTDGSEEPQKLVTVRIRADLHPATDSNALWLFGRRIAYRLGRDFPVRLGDGVVIIEGDFARRGGSRKYPALEPLPGTVLEIRDVPAELAREVAGKEWIVQIEEG